MKSMILFIKKLCTTRIRSYLELTDLEFSYELAMQKTCSLTNLLGFMEPGNMFMYKIFFMYIEFLVIILLIVFLMFSCLSIISKLFQCKSTKWLMPLYPAKGIEIIFEAIFIMLPLVLIIGCISESISFLYGYEYGFRTISFCIDIIGHQWYWEYNYHIYSCNLDSDSWVGDAFTQYSVVMYSAWLDEYTDDIDRLYYVTNKLMIPVNTNVLLNITSDDVIHSFSLPQFGIKVDAVPGKIASTILYANYEGIYIGQCSELCGVRHAYMPIVVQVCDASYRFTWCWAVTHELK